MLSVRSRRGVETTHCRGGIFTKFVIPLKNLVMNYDYIKLYEEILKIKNPILNSENDEKLKFACKKAIIENPHLDFSGHLNVVAKYLQLILDFPQLDLGQIIKPQ